MIVSTKGRYALRAMIDLAQHNSGEYIPLKEIAKRQEISEKYLESILPALTKAGFLEGVRGKGGGYKLARSPEHYTIGSIIRIVEGQIKMVACLDCSPNRCARANSCPTLPMWEKLQKTVDEFFDNITLAELSQKDSDIINYSI